MSIFLTPLSTQNQCLSPLCYSKKYRSHILAEYICERNFKQTQTVLPGQLVVFLDKSNGTCDTTFIKTNVVVCLSVMKQQSFVLQTHNNALVNCKANKHCIRSTCYFLLSCIIAQNTVVVSVAHFHIRVDYSNSSGSDF